MNRSHEVCDIMNILNAFSIKKVLHYDFCGVCNSKFHPRENLAQLHDVFTLQFMTIRNFLLSNLMIYF